MVDRTRLWRRLHTAALVAAIALVGAIPHVWYLTKVGFAERLSQHFPRTSPEQIIQTDLLSIALIVSLTSLVGALLSKRYGLYGLGDAASLRRARWLIVGVAPALGAVCYLLFGRAIAERVPGYYPTTTHWAMARALKVALFDEVVARFGMMTIIAGVFRMIWLANLLQASFFTVIATLGLSFYGISPQATGYFAASVGTSFVISYVLGVIYARYGLIPAMLFHFVLGLRFVVHALIH